MENRVARLSAAGVARGFRHHRNNRYVDCAYKRQIIYRAGGTQPLPMATGDLLGRRTTLYCEFLVVDSQRQLVADYCCTGDCLPADIAWLVVHAAVSTVGLVLVTTAILTGPGGARGNLRPQPVNHANLFTPTEVQPWPVQF